MRLSIINFAGIARTLVAGGTDSDASIDATTRPATPRSGSIVAALGVIKTGAGLTGACAGAGVETIGAAGAGAITTGAGVETTGAGVETGATGAGVETIGAASVDGAGVEIFCVALGIGGVPDFNTGAVFVTPGLYVLKNSIHEGSTEFGSPW